MPAAISVMRPTGERRVYITGGLPLKYGIHADAVTVPDPARWFVEMLREALAKEGIMVRGKAPNPLVAGRSKAGRDGAQGNWVYGIRPDSGDRSEHVEAFAELVCATVVIADGSTIRAIE
jgi:hypothetical protein